MSNNMPLMAARIRKGIVDAVYAAQSGHPGGSLGCADILTYLYFKEMNVNPADPKNPMRDRFVLSKGHCAPALYSALAHRGFFPVSDLVTLRRRGSHLQGHPSMNCTPGVDMSTGSLGQGVSTACGMALAAKVKHEPWRAYTLLGDGELAEGQCWEAFMFAAHHRLDNLRVIVDLNGLQIDGRTKDVMNSEPVADKFRAFGFEVIECDGNDFDALDRAFGKIKSISGRPSCILARTTKGKGVGFMENLAAWHGKAPNADEYARASAELDNTIKSLEVAS